MLLLCRLRLDRLCHRQTILGKQGSWLQLAFMIRHSYCLVQGFLRIHSLVVGTAKILVNNYPTWLRLIAVEYCCLSLCDATPRTHWRVRNSYSDESLTTPDLNSPEPANGRQCGRGLGWRFGDPMYSQMFSAQLSVRAGSST